MPEGDELYNSDEERERLARILEERYLAMLEAVNTALVKLYGLDAERFVVTDAAANQVLVEAARQVVRIDETTRQAIVEQLRVGQALGLSTWEIANGQPDIGYRGIDGLYQETWKGRAETIARTELQHANNVSALNRYTASGMVDMVQIIDGDDWDAECAARNGKIVPVSERPPLLHPNCTMTVVPVLREGII